MWTVTRTRVSAIAAAVLATACGGGDDGGDVVPPPPTQVLISAANQDTVARASLAAIMPFLNVPVVPGASQAPATAVGSRLAWLALRPVRLGIAPPGPAAAGMARPQAQYQATYPCQVAGTATAAWDDRDNNGAVSAGDSVSVSFGQCDDGIGVIFNGGMGMTIASYAQTPATEEMTGSMTFQSMSMVEPSGSFAMNGGVAFRLGQAVTADGAEMLGSYTVAAEGFTVSKQGGAGSLSDTFAYRAGFAVTDRDFSSSLPGVPSWEVISASGSFGSQTLGGDLGLATVTPFRTVYSDPADDSSPLEGQLIATGRSNTKLGLAATATPQARMDLCDDGDNAWEASKMVAWDWLLQ